MSEICEHIKNNEVICQNGYQAVDFIQTLINSFYFFERDTDKCSTTYHVRLQFPKNSNIFDLIKSE